MLIGNLGKDPDVQFLEGNIGVAKFPLATTETFKDRTGKLVSQTEWHTVVLWRGLAEREHQAIGPVEEGRGVDDVGDRQVVESRAAQAVDVLRPERARRRGQRHRGRHDGVPALSEVGGDAGVE